LFQSRGSLQRFLLAALLGLRALPIVLVVIIGVHALLFALAYGRDSLLVREKRREEREERDRGEEEVRVCVREGRRD